MLIGKRMIALFLMTVVSTASPAVYQKGIEPRVEGANCNIEITDIEYVTDSALTRTDVLTLKAYLRVENQAPNEVILSRLNLDMYHRSALRGRFELIGHFNTTEEFRVPAATVNEDGGVEPGYIETRLSDDDQALHYTSETGKAAEKYTNRDTYAYITFRRLANYYGSDAPVYEALSDLIQRKFLNVRLKGEARIGPVPFEYQRDQTINLNVWDTNFIIEDIFPAIPDSLGGSDLEWDPVVEANSSKYDFNTLFFHLKTRNPSRLPVILHNYTFDLLQEDGSVLGRGIYSQNFQSFYDPDLKYYVEEDAAYERKTISQAMGYSYTDFVVLPAGQWVDLVMGFNFTALDSFGVPVASLTRQTLYNMVSDLFMEEKLTYSLSGKGNMILGTFDRGIHIGLNTSIGFQKPFTLDEVNFWQHSMDNPTPILASVVMGAVNATNMDIRSSTNMVGINYSTSLNFTNPYRFDMQMLDVDCSVFRTETLNPEEASSGIHQFFAGNPDGSLSSGEKTFMRAHRVEKKSGTLDFTLSNTMIAPSVTNIPMQMYNEYSTDNFVDTSGLAYVLKDYNINPQIMNLTNPVFLMSPDGIQDTTDYLQVKQRTFTKSYVDPLKIVRYLIQQGIDPLQLLREVDTTYQVYEGMASYMPLRGSFFGTNRTYYYDDVYRSDESQELPYTGRVYSGGDGYFALPQAPLIDAWSNYYDGVGQFYAYPKPSEINQYDVVQWGALSVPQPTNHWEVWGQYGAASNHFFHYYKGAIFESNRLDWDNSSCPIGSYYDYLPNNPRYDDVIWRYHGNAPWGYRYDFEYFERGYFMGISTGAGEQGALLQNFTIDSRVADSDLEITSVKMGISYKFPMNPNDPNAFAVFGLGHYNSTISGDRYRYLLPSQSDDYVYTTGEKATFAAGDGRAGWILAANATPTDDSPDWIHRTIDVTAEVMSALGNYSLTGNEDFLKMEIMVAADGANTNQNPIFFDDVTFQIEYARNTPGKVTLLDLWDYIGDYDGEDYYDTDDPEYDAGNMYNFLDGLNFNATQFMEFMNDDPVGYGINPGSGTEINFLDFMKYNGLKPYDITDVFEEKYREILAADPVNFLDMLTSTKYIIPDPSTLSVVEQQDWIPYSNMVNLGSPFGPRRETGDYWVVEDPYVASREMVRALQSNLFDAGAGTFLRNVAAGEELWFMLDNMEIYLPWVNLYLATHGWSNDQIWDMWEAIGMGAETKSDAWIHYENSSTYFDTYGPTGLMRFSGTASMDLTVNVHYNILGFEGDIAIPTSDDSDFTYEMFLGQTMRTGLSDVYTALTSASNELYVPGEAAVTGSTPLIEHGATLSPPSSSDFDLDAPPTGDGMIDVTVYGTGTLYTDTYGMWIWIKSPSGGIQKLDKERSAGNSYFDNNDGMNTAGAKKLVSLLRNEFKIADSTFIRTGGDPVGFFKFLDDYYYEQRFDPSNLDEFSSYEFLNFQNVKGIDFVEVITGYNWTADAFDTNMNGKADDWRVPYDRTIFNLPAAGGSLPDYSNFWQDVGYFDNLGRLVDPRSDWEGWGTNFYDNRIFWCTDPGLIGPDDSTPYADYNGTIIWTDSPDFQYIDEASQRGLDHRAGDIHIDDGNAALRDRFWEGAPPIVNLIDMLAWLSRVTGTPDPDTLLRWLAMGSTPETKTYEIRDRMLTNAEFSTFTKKGLGVDGTWSMLQNMTMNATGMMNWVENVKYLDGFKWLYQMEQTGKGALNPLDLIEFLTYPNIATYLGGTYGFLYRPSFGTATDEVPVRVNYSNFGNLTVAEQESLITDLLALNDFSSMHISVNRPAFLSGIQGSNLEFVPETISAWAQNLDKVDGYGVNFSVSPGTTASLELDMTLDEYALWDDGKKLIDGVKFGLFIGDQPGMSGGDVRRVEIYDYDDGDWNQWFIGTGPYSSQILEPNGPVYWLTPAGIQDVNPTLGFAEQFCYNREFRMRIVITADPGAGIQSYMVDCLNSTGPMNGYLEFEALIPDDGLAFLDWTLDIDGFLPELYQQTGDSLKIEVKDIHTGSWIPWYNTGNGFLYEVFESAAQPVPTASLSITNMDDDDINHPYTIENIQDANDGKYAEFTHIADVTSYLEFDLQFPDSNALAKIQDIGTYGVKIRMDQNATAEVFNGGECMLQVFRTGTGWEDLGLLEADQAHDVSNYWIPIWKEYVVPLSGIDTADLANYITTGGGYHRLQFRFEFTETELSHRWNSTRLDYITLLPGSYGDTTSMNFIGADEGDYYAASEKIDQFYDRTENKLTFRFILQSPDSNFFDLALDAVKFTVEKPADELAWKLFNGSWWAEEKNVYTWWPDTTGFADAKAYFDSYPSAVDSTLAYKFFARYHELEVPANPYDTQNLAYNYFRILQGLYVDPVSWLNKILETVEYPLEFLAATEIIDYDALIAKAADIDAASNAKLNGTIAIQLYGKVLEGDSSTKIDMIAQHFSLTATYHMRWAFNKYRFTNDNFSYRN